MFMLNGSFWTEGLLKRVISPPEPWNVPLEGVFTCLVGAPELAGLLADIGIGVPI